MLVTATRSVEAWKSYNMKVNAIIDYIRGCVFKKTKSCIDDYAHDDCNYCISYWRCTNSTSAMSQEFIAYYSFGLLLEWFVTVCAHANILL